MSTRVVNIRDLPADPALWPPDHVYIGRANPRRRVARSKWANPYTISARFSREQAIAAYRDFLEHTPEKRAAVGELRGKVLVCWCAPLPCHGDVLAEMADAGATS